MAMGIYFTHVSSVVVYFVSYVTGPEILPPGRALSTCTYGEVGPIFLGQNIAKSDSFGSK